MFACLRRPSLAALLISLPVLGQAPSQTYSAPASLPLDRAADTYAIYSQLLPGDLIEWGNVPRTQWLLEDVTGALPLEVGCAKGGMTNPHEAIRAPEERQTEFAEVLADFDANCHNRYRLEGSQIHEKLPVHMLDEAARKRYVDGVAHYMPPANDIMRAPATPDEFKGAAGMHSFTAVYFNRAHTMAMTEIGMYCGGLCGNWSWVVLQKHGTSWSVLPWAYSSVIS